MDVIVNQAEDGAIEFINDGFIIYDITEDAQRAGKDFWLGTLQHKRWFTPEVKDQFDEVWL